MKTRLVMIGPPGAPTAEVADAAADQIGVTCISVRDAFQLATRQGLELATRLRRFMNAEQLPPDELVAALVVRRLTEPDAADGFVFWASAGLPSMPAVVQSLEVMQPLVVALSLADAEAALRLTGRRICQSCGARWHVDSQPPAVAGVCDWCNAELHQRKDDTPTAVARHLAEYRQHSSGVLAQLRVGGRLVEVDAAAPEQDVANEVIRRLQQNEPVHPIPDRADQPSSPDHHPNPDPNRPSKPSSRDPRP